MAGENWAENMALLHLSIALVRGKGHNGDWGSSSNTLNLPLGVEGFLRWHTIPHDSVEE